MGRIARADDGAPRRDGPLRLMILPVRVTGRLIIGHTRSISDHAEPVLVRECDVLEPPPSGADLRCPGCVSRTQIGRLGQDTLALLEHQPGCTRMAELAALA